MRSSCAGIKAAWDRGWRQVSSDPPSPPPCVCPGALGVYRAGGRPCYARAHPCTFRQWLFPGAPSQGAGRGGLCIRLLVQYNGAVAKVGCLLAGLAGLQGCEAVLHDRPPGGDGRGRAGYRRRTVQWLQAECRRGRRATWASSFTVSNFTPKPHTPFQWHSVATEELQRKQRLLRGALARLPGVEVLGLGDVRLSAMEDFLGRGDRSVGPLCAACGARGHQRRVVEQRGRRLRCLGTPIREAGVEWKTPPRAGREWDVMEHLGDPALPRPGGKGRVDTGEMRDARLDAPLPWDIINAGSPSGGRGRPAAAPWRPPLSRTAPTRGSAPSAGCVDDFGQNVVAQVPRSRPLTGTSSLTARGGSGCRLRFAKLGSMVLIGHLDLTRLFRPRPAARPPRVLRQRHPLLLRSLLALPLPSATPRPPSSSTSSSPPPSPRLPAPPAGPSSPPRCPSWRRGRSPCSAWDAGKNEDPLAELVHGVEYLLAIARPRHLRKHRPQSPPLLPPPWRPRGPFPEPAGRFAGGGYAAGWRSGRRACWPLGAFRVQSSSKRTGKFRVIDLRGSLRELQVLPPPPPSPWPFPRAAPRLSRSQSPEPEGGPGRGYTARCPWGWH